jgi:hypothetical protein
MHRGAVRIGVIFGIRAADAHVPFTPQEAKLKIKATLTILTFVASSAFAFAQSIYQQDQAFPVKMGTSGGNVNDRSKRFCCSGTLGSLVSKGGSQFILSNSHVLGISGSASPGDDISQPGMIDTGCAVNPNNIVADFVASPAPGVGNVDAALAAVKTGAVATNGEILGIGVPSSSPASPTIGRGVAKAGRTTGLTCSAIGSTNTDVNVQYQAGCGQGKKFVVSYQDQIVINSSSFSAGGDSGSLIVTSDTKQPVALLYAGSSSTTIGNPIQDVISALGISFVGGAGGTVSCPGGGGASSASSGPRGLSQAELARAKAAKNSRRQDLFRNPAVQGVGIGEDPENPGLATIVIYVEQGQEHGQLPDEIDGLKTQIVRTDALRATGWNEKLMGGSCSAK